MIAYTPPLLFLLSWVFALVGIDAPGTGSATPFDEQALRWMLFLGMGWSILGGALMHTVFARSTAASIGWQTNGFQYEVGFASLGIGLAAIYASNLDVPQAWIAASLAGGLFLLLAGFNHIVEIFREKNYAPGNTAILISDLGVPISLLVLLFATGAI
jgi:predicted membrane channel-forming protein YqfA (hemolysin III family)